MAEQTVNFRLKATNDASPALAKVADEMRRLNHEAVTARAGVASWGSAWGSASTTIAGGAKTAGGALDALGNSAKGVAAGGFQQLLSTIPGVGGALANLAQTLGGFPLLLGGIAAAGLGVLKFLQGLGQESDAALAKVTALAEGIGAATRQTALEVASIRKQAAGDKQGALEADTAREIAAIEDTKNKRIAAAKAELDALDLFGRKRTELSQEGRNEILAAEADAALKTLVINEKKKADLKKLDAERLADEKKNRDEAVKKEEEAAEKTKKIAADTKASITSALAIFKDLPGFEDTAKKLGVAEFVEKQKDAIAELGKAFALGVIDQAKLDAGTAALTARMQEAITLGYVPTVEAATKVTEAVTVAAEATKAAGDSIAASLFRVGAASEETIARLDALIAKGKEMQAAAGGRPVPTGITGAGGGTTTGTTTMRPGEGMGGNLGGADWSRYKTMLGPILNAPKGSGLTPLTDGSSRYGYDLSKLPPGYQGGGGGGRGTPGGAGGYGVPQPSVTSPWRDAPAGAATYNITVNNTGTVIGQDRDWRSLVETIRSSTSDAY